MSIELDSAAVDRVLRLGGRDLLLRLVSTAREQMRGRLDEIEAAAAEEPPDFARIELAAHSLKSSSAYVGAEELRLLALSMEELARKYLAEEHLDRDLDQDLDRELDQEDDGSEGEAEMGELLWRTREVFDESLLALGELEETSR